MCKRNIDQSPLTHPQLGTWSKIQACSSTGNPNGDLSVHRLVLNPLSHTSQGSSRVFYKQDIVAAQFGSFKNILDVSIYLFEHTACSHTDNFPCVNVLSADSDISVSSKSMLSD